MQHRKRRTKVRRFRILIGFFVAKKLEKASFSKKQFFHARGDISEMQQSALMDWCDSNTEAKAQILKVQQKEASMAEQAAKRQQMWDSLMACSAGYTEFDDEFVRQIIQKITVEDAETIRIHFRDLDVVLEQEVE